MMTEDVELVALLAFAVRVGLLSHPLALDDAREIGAARLASFVVKLFEQRNVDTRTDSHSN